MNHTVQFRFWLLRLYSSTGLMVSFVPLSDLDSIEPRPSCWRPGWTTQLVVGDIGFSANLPYPILVLGMRFLSVAIGITEAASGSFCLVLRILRFLIGALDKSIFGLRNLRGVSALSPRVLQMLVFVVPIRSHCTMASFIWRLSVSVHTDGFPFLRFDLTRAPG